MEANRFQLLLVQDQPAVKDKSRLVHFVIDLLVVEMRVPEFVPLGAHDNCIGTLASIIGALGDAKLLFEVRAVIQDARLGEVEPDLTLGNLRIVDGDVGTLVAEILAQSDCRRFASVAGVLLKGKAQDGNLLAGKGVEETRDDTVEEAPLLVFVHLDNLDGLELGDIGKAGGTANLAPICSNLWKVQALAEVDQIEDVLLETTASETDTGLQELGTDSGVKAASIADFVDIGARSLADCGKRVDGRNPLGQQGIGGELRKFRRPEVHGDNLLMTNPASIDIRQRRSRRPAGVRVQGSDQDAVGIHQIGNGRALGEELGVGEDVEVDTSTGICIQLCAASVVAQCGCNGFLQ